MVQLPWEPDTEKFGGNRLAAKLVNTKNALIVDMPDVVNDVGISFINRAKQGQY